MTLSKVESVMMRYVLEKLNLQFFSNTKNVLVGCGIKQ